MIYVLAPTVRQARYWLEEFGTNPRRRDVLILPAPERSDPDAQPPEWLDLLNGRRWQEGDEWIVVGDAGALDHFDVRFAADRLMVPDEVRERELQAQ